MNDRTQDQLDFMRHRGKTPSADTGPEFDHTLGTEEGKTKEPIQKKLWNKWEYIKFSSLQAFLDNSLKKEKCLSVV